MDPAENDLFSYECVRVAGSPAIDL